MRQDGIRSCLSVEIRFVILLFFVRMREIRRVQCEGEGGVPVYVREAPCCNNNFTHTADRSMQAHAQRTFYAKASFLFSKVGTPSDFKGAIRNDE